MIMFLSQYTGKTLIVSQPSIWKKHFILQHEDEIIGKITESGFFDSRIHVNFTVHEWEIYYPRFWRSEISIREKGKENPFASYSQKFFSKEGTIFLPKGQRLKIKFGTFKNRQGIYSTSGICLVSIRNKFGFRLKTMIDIINSSEILDEYPWVIMLAWHLIMKRKRAASAA